LFVIQFTISIYIYNSELIKSKQAIDIQIDYTQKIFSMKSDLEYVEQMTELR